MTPEESLQQAKEIIRERQKIYGPPHKNFERVARFWSTYLGRPITEVDVSVMMTLLKISRLCETPNHEDGWIDALGYIALGSDFGTMRDPVIRNEQYHREQDALNSKNGGHENE